MAIQDDEEARLRFGLERWRVRTLDEIERAIAEQNYIRGRAEFGLKCAHETPGVFDEEFIEDLWEDLNHAATELARLEEECERLRAMNLPQMIVAFNQDTTALSSWERPGPQAEGALPQSATEALAHDAPTRGRGSEDAGNPQVEKIVTAWREILAIELDPGRAERHLQELNAWEESWRKRRKKEDGD